ncbi:MAG: hypothetical protein ACQEXQ_10155 [Bacillota bacterium]
MELQSNINEAFFPAVYPSNEAAPNRRVPNKAYGGRRAFIGVSVIKKAVNPDKISAVVLKRLQDLKSQGDLFIFKLENRHSKEERELNVGFFSSAV